MTKTCLNCGHEETDDAFYCSCCKARISVTSVFDGTTPKIYDDYLPEPPYIVWPSAIGTMTMTRDQFFARTYMLIVTMLLVTVAGLAWGKWLAGPLYSGIWALILYASWKWGRRHARLQ